ncbi:MAG: DUF4105 domain-containing protein [Bacteroidota bacterium]
MRKYITLVFICLFAFEVIGQSIPLSDEAEIRVLTFGPDQDNLYSSFWHSGIRVIDRKSNIDWVYDYGRFDFDNPNFYTDFAKGYLRYSMGVADYPRLKAVYIYHNRSIEEQVINLNPLQKQKLFDYLQNNRKPENRHYFYDYYYNNCATKIRDVFKEVLGDSIRFDLDYVEVGLSFRQLTDSCTVYQPWGDYGIDLALGQPIDKKASSWEYMFLPEFIKKGFGAAEVITKSGIQPAVANYQLTYKATEENYSNGWMTPHSIFWLLFILTVLITLWNWMKQVHGKWFDFVFFLVLGIAGIILCFIWFATDHHAAANNYNVVWALPTHVLIAGLLISRKYDRVLTIYFYLTLGISIILLLSWNFIPQQLHTANIPIVLAVALRSIHIIKFRKK